VTKEQDKDLQIVKDVSRVLREQFDTVQIFTTRVLPSGDTVNVNYGDGNFFARFGQVEMWRDQQYSESE